MESKVIAQDIQTIAASLGDLAKRFSGKTLLITGGAGFLGNYFIGTIDYLNKNVLEKPCKIISVDNFVTGVRYRVEEGENFKAIKHNIKEPIVVDEDVDFIIHAAGIASPKFYRDLKIETIDVATMGTRNMLELAKDKKVESMIFFSSSEVYGDPDPNFVPTAETYCGNVSCTGPRANYDESKRLGETLCVAYKETHDVPIKMIRPFNVFGPGMRSDDYRVIPNFVSFVRQGKDLPVYGSGNNTRTFCYISDAINGFLRVLLSSEEGEPFNIGNDNDEISIEQLAEIVASVFAHEVKIQRLQGPNDAYGSADPKRRCPDLTKAKSRLEYFPTMSIKEGIGRFVQWVIETSEEDVSKLVLKEK